MHQRYLARRDVLAVRGSGRRTDLEQSA